MNYNNYEYQYRYFVNFIKINMHLKKKKKVGVRFLIVTNILPIPEQMHKKIRYDKDIQHYILHHHIQNNIPLQT